VDHHSALLIPAVWSPKSRHINVIKTVAPAPSRSVRSETFAGTWKGSTWGTAWNARDVRKGYLEIARTISRGISTSSASKKPVELRDKSQVYC